MQLALSTNLTIHDSSYLALAEDLKVPVFTADQALLKAAARGIETRHLKSYHGAHP